MKANIVKKVISKEDIEIIKSMAKKYNMNIVEFGRFLGKSSNEKGVRFQIRFSENELELVDKKVSQLGVSRSKYCRMSYQWFIENEIYKTMNIYDFKEIEERRDMRVSVIFSNPDEYNKMRKVANDFSIPFSALLRYCTLNYLYE